MGRPSFQVTKMTTNGRISVPLCIREKTGWSDGAVLEFEVIDKDTVVIFRKKGREERLQEALQKGVSLKETHGITSDKISEMCDRVRKDLYSEIYG